MVADAAAPSVPVAVSPARNADLQISTPNFVWRPAGKATSYQVSIDGGAVKSPWVGETSWRTPVLSGGPHAWQVRSRNPYGTSASSASIPFTVPARPAAITLSAGQGQVGQQVGVTGSGFGAGEDVALAWNADPNRVLGTAGAAGDGTIATSVTIPASPKGAHTLLATGLQSGREATAAFNIDRAAVRVSPAKGSPASGVNVSGDGFVVDEPVLVYWDDQLTGFGNARADDAGSVAVGSQVPSLPAGPHNVRLYGELSDQQGAAVYTVTPSLSLSPTSGGAGTAVGVIGRGWPAAANVRIYWNRSGSNPGTLLCALKTSTRGSFTCRFAAPAGAAGTYPIVALRSGYKVTRWFASTGSGATGARVARTATPTGTPRASVTAASLPTSTAPAPATFTPTTQPEASPTETTAPTATATATESATPTPTASPDPTETATPIPTLEPTATARPTETIATATA